MTTNHRGGAPTALLATVVVLAAAPGARAQDVHLLVISGLSGAPHYAEQFNGWAATIVDAAVERYGLPATNVTWLAESADAHPKASGKSDRETVSRTFADLSERVGPDDRLLVVLIGHGTERNGEARINLPGRDLAAGDFAAFLSSLPSRQVALVNTASASGGWVPVLSGEGRTIVTATRSGREANEALFGGYFARALADDGADTDKDARISVLEAFNYAVHEVARIYEEEDRLLTEHALLDDNGDGQGSRAPGPGADDGALARRFHLAAPVAAMAGATAEVADPELRRLYQEKADLERRLDELRAAKDGMDPETYDSELEDLLVELALADRAIRAREGGTR